MLKHLTNIFEKVQTVRALMRWAATGPALIAIGVSQVVYGWVGETLYLRYIYPAICILLGLLFLSMTIYCIYCILPPSEEDLATADCPKCGERLRTAQAQQCFLCGADWHPPAKSKI